MICNGKCLKCHIDPCPYPDIPEELTEAPLSEKEWEIADWIDIQSIIHSIANHEDKINLIYTRHTKKKDKNKKPQNNNRLRYQGIKRNGAALVEAQGKIIEARTQRGMSGRELAEKMGVARQTVTYWETGFYKANWSKVVEALPELRYVAEMEREREYKEREERITRKKEQYNNEFDIPKLRYMRHKTKLSAREVAEKIGVKNAQTIHRWETGKTRIPKARYEQILKLYEDIQANQ